MSNPDSSLNGFVVELPPRGEHSRVAQNMGAALKTALSGCDHVFSRKTSASWVRP